jgi:hypothetical protein
MSAADPVFPSSSPCRGVRRAGRRPGPRGVATRDPGAARTPRGSWWMIQARLAPNHRWSWAGLDRPSRLSGSPKKPPRPFLVPPRSRHSPVSRQARECRPPRRKSRPRGHGAPQILRHQGPQFRSGTIRVMSYCFPKDGDIGMLRMRPGRPQEVPHDRNVTGLDGRMI